MSNAEPTETLSGHTYSHVPILPSSVEVPLWARSARGPKWEPGQLLLDEFEVVRLLGQGGMGVVYLVRQISTNTLLAAKRTHLLDPESRRRFLGELQTWIDLPEHPHLIFCRFFRTIDEEVVIFTDYAERGSLADRIRSGPLDEGEIFDIAIQMAWGLDSLHQRGLVHQDVKPSNVLMGDDGRARIADFGLARAWSRISQSSATDQSSTNLVSGAAMTPAYCSPEQALHNPVTRATDVWSWAIAVLEMFVGRVPCCSEGGPTAPSVLKEFLAGKSARAGFLRRQPKLADVLTRCFELEPDDRPPNLTDLGAELAEAFSTRGGRVYKRSAPDESRNAPPLGELTQTTLGFRWESPRVWLIRATLAAGRDVSEVDSIQPPLSTTRRGQAVSDLAFYEQARQLYDKALSAGREEVEWDLALLLLHKSSIHTASGDLPGALASIDASLEKWLLLVRERGRREYTGHLSRAYLQKIRLLRQLGDNLQAASLADRIHELWERMGNRRRRRELRPDLAASYVNKGLALRALGRLEEAGNLYARARRIWEAMVEQEKNEECLNDLAWGYLNQASLLAAQGEAREAIRLCDEAIGIRRRLVQQDDRSSHRADLARAHLHKANALRSAKDPKGALVAYDRTLEMLGRLVEKEGRDDLAPDLARVLLARAHAVRQLGQSKEAVLWCGRAVSLLERLTTGEGRQELIPDLARAQRHQSNMLRSAKRNGEAYTLADSAVSIWRRLIRIEAPPDIQSDLARALVSRALCLAKMTSYRKASEDFEEARRVRLLLIEQESEANLGGFHAEMARDTIDQAETCLALGKTTEAQALAKEAVEGLEVALDQQDRPDYRRALQRGHLLLERR